MDRNRDRKRVGGNLRGYRMRLGLSTREVAQLSQVVAQDQGSKEFVISHARLVQIENEQSPPSLRKLYTLSVIYGRSITELLGLYLDLDAAARIHRTMSIAATHPVSIETYVPEKAITFPGRFHSHASPLETNLLQRIVETWGEIPVGLLQDLNFRRFRYGLIGLADYRMHPLIRPGSLVQIDERQRVVESGRYRSEHDRPIYFLELRDAYMCSWCDVSHNRLIAIPHPLSPCRLEVFEVPSEAEIIGRVTGMALRLESATEPARATPRPGRSNSANGSSSNGSGETIDSARGAPLDTRVPGSTA